MKRSGPLTALFLFSFALVATSAPQFRAEELRMTKIVAYLVSDRIKPDSFAAKPKTIYRAGNKYARTEEGLDRKLNTHTLIITKEPDSWVINLANMTGRHVLDPGPSFDVRIPLLSFTGAAGETDAEEAFKGLEFGNEYEFFKEHGAKKLSSRRIEGRDFAVLSLKEGPRELVLFCGPATHKPFRLDVMRDGKLDCSIRYVSYSTDLSFDPGLFEIPEGVKITESDKS